MGFGREIRGKKEKEMVAQEKKFFKVKNEARFRIMIDLKHRGPKKVRVTLDQFSTRRGTKRLFSFVG